MGLWVRMPFLRTGETVRWSAAANRMQSEKRAVGGRLSLTQDRLLFEPNRLDAITGGRPWKTTLSDIAKISIEPSKHTLAIGAAAAKLRRRLRLDMVNSDVELFVINHVNDAVETLTSAVASRAIDDVAMDLGRAVGGQVLARRGQR